MPRHRKCLALTLCMLACALTLFGSFSRQAFLLTYGVGTNEAIDLKFHFGYHGFCLFKPDLGCTNYANKDATLRPIEEDTFIRVGQDLSYAAIGLGVMAIAFLGMSLMVNWRRRTSIIWGVLLGILLPISSLAISSLAFASSACVDEGDPSNYPCRPGLGSIAAFAGGILYFIVACVICCCVKPMTIQVPSVSSERKSDEDLSGQASTMIEPEPCNSSISSEE